MNSYFRDGSKAYNSALALLNFEGSSVKSSMHKVIWSIEGAVS